MTEAGRPAELREIAADLAARDLRDRTRSAAPLREAADAMVLDTSALDPAAAVAAAIALVRSRMK
jgi:cytidylate kinase